MKFNVGEWVLLKPGVKASHCQQVRQVRFNADKTAVSLFCVGYKQDERCLDGPALFVTITTPKPDVIRMQTVHYKGTGAKMPAFDLALDATPLDYEKTADKISPSGLRIPALSSAGTLSPSTITTRASGSRALVTVMVRPC